MRLAIGEFLVNALQIDGIEHIVDKKIAPLIFDYISNEGEDSLTAQGLVTFEGWEEGDVKLNVIKPEDENFSISQIEDMTSMELLFMQLVCIKPEKRKRLLEDIILIFQEIITKGIRN